MARVRSPNYPNISLKEAIDRIKKVHSQEGQNSAARETIARHMGYNALHGASAKTLSAIGKYGLLENTGSGEARVSDLAMKILYPETDAEKEAALKEAAFSPALFAEIRDKWPDRQPSADNLKAYLARRGFSQGALDGVIECFQDTMSLVTYGGKSYDLDSTALEREVPKKKPKQDQMSSHIIEGLSGRAGEAPTFPNIPYNIAFDGRALKASAFIRTEDELNDLISLLESQRPAVRMIRPAPAPALQVEDEDEDEAAD